MATIISTGSCGDNATFNLYDDGLLEILGSGEITQRGADTYPWAAKRSIITTVTIADGITRIPIYTFHECTNLKNVTIGSGVTGIDAYSFSDCTSLASITLPENLSKLSGNTFNGCSSLTRVVIKNKTKVVTISGISPFIRTPIADGNGKIYVPYGLVTAYKTDKGQVTGTGWSTFANIITYGGTSLTELFTDIANSLRKKTNKTDSIVAYAFPNEIEKLSISDYLSIMSNGEAIFSGTTIPTNAFSADKVNKVTIQNGVTKIEAGAFKDCYAFTEITIPDSVTDIYSSAFSGCENLNTVKLGKGITEIEPETFFNCTNLNELYLYYEEDVVLLDSTAFEGVDMDACIVYVPESLLDMYQEDEQWSQYYIEAISE